MEAIKIQTFSFFEKLKNDLIKKFNSGLREN